MGGRLREILLLCLLIWGLWQSDSALASTAGRPNDLRCRELVKDLKDYRTAQSTLMQSFLQKNETVAETLEIYAGNLAKPDKKARKANQASLQQVAQAFRSHGERESKLVRQFDTSSSELLDQVSECLSRIDSVSSETSLTR